MSRSNSQAPLATDNSSAITVGMLRDAGERLHITCGGCGHEREPRLDAPPFDRIDGSVRVTDVRAVIRLRCSARGCGETRKIWVNAAKADASADDRRMWGWTDAEITAAELRKGA